LRVCSVDGPEYRNLVVANKDLQRVLRFWQFAPDWKVVARPSSNIPDPTPERPVVRPRAVRATRTRPVAARRPEAPPPAPDPPEVPEDGVWWAERDFAAKAAIRLSTVTTLLRAGLLRSERPGRVSVDQAMGFLNKYVSVREILRDWPNGAQIEKALRLAQVPPALPPQRAGEPFYQRSYVQQIAAAFDRRNQVARSFIKA
jgi:hypothetical protein